jgi:hypothetical protein
MKFTSPAGVPDSSAAIADPVSKLGSDARDFWRMSDIFELKKREKYMSNCLQLKKQKDKNQMTSTE